MEKGQLIAKIHHNFASDDDPRLHFVIAEVLASFPVGDEPVPKKGPMVLEKVD